jgi:hypothetical protein
MRGESELIAILGASHPAGIRFLCVSLSEKGEGESFDLLNESIFVPADSSDVSLSENLFSPAVTTLNYCAEADRQ